MSIGDIVGDDGSRGVTAVEGAQSGESFLTGGILQLCQISKCDIKVQCSNFSKISINPPTADELLWQVAIVVKISHLTVFDG